MVSEERDIDLFIRSRGWDAGGGKSLDMLDAAGPTSERWIFKGADGKMVEGSSAIREWVELLDVSDTSMSSPKTKLPVGVGSDETVSDSRAIGEKLGEVLIEQWEAVKDGIVGKHYGSSKV